MTGADLTRAPDDILAGYLGGGPSRGSLDEMIEPGRGLRPAWRGVGEVLDELGQSGLAERHGAITRLLEDDGVTYRAHGSTADQPWKLDPLPLLIDTADWTRLESGIVQRAELLDCIPTDLYGPRRLISSGLLPPALIFSHGGFLRVADRITLPGARQLFLASADLARDDDGAWRVLADRTQAPSGAGFAMENRSVLSRALPGLYRGTGVHRIAPFFRTMRQSLQRIAPPRADRQPPRMVLLSPGAESETAFDQAFLSALLGLPLAVAADLTVRDGRVWQRSLHRLEPVDVILRRVDDGYCDPLELRPDSKLGVPGLLEAARNGTVSIVNGLGSGVLENPGLFEYLPAICQSLLGESLRIDSAQTWWCGDPVNRRHVLSRLEHLVIKPTTRRIGSSSRLGWELSNAARATLAARIEAEPYAWVGQEPLAMSTAPTLQRSGLDARPIVLRTFGVADEDSYQVMPGGLTRAPQDPEMLVISNANGAISKDVWVLSDSSVSGDEAHLPGLSGPETVSAAVSPRVAEDLYWLGRYTERAESVIRLLRVVDNRWRDVHPAPDPSLARCLLTMLQTLTAVTATWPGFVGSGSGTRLGNPQREILALIGDERRTGTLAHDLSRVRGLANAVRDQLSADTWTVLSGVDRSLLPFTVASNSGSDGAGLSRSLDATSAGLVRLLQAMLAFSGLVAESMVRDTGWYLLDAGRRIERAQQINGLLRHGLAESQPSEAQSLTIESVLIAAESIITHRRRYPARGGVDTVLELLLTDANNPRSLAFQLDRLEADLAQLPAADDETARSLELLATIRAQLASADLAQVAASDGNRRPALIELLDSIGANLRALHKVLDAAHFTKQGSLQPLDGLAVLEPV
ncbi:circularly permuted type 2 ATP-grasp protein [soil metagenome]